MLVLPQERNSTAFVFTSYINDTGFLGQSVPYVVMLGLAMPVLCNTGFDGAAHMAEETTFASTVGTTVDGMRSCIRSHLGFGGQMVARCVATLSGLDSAGVQGQEGTC